VATPARLWALAPAAIIVRYNLDDPTLLGGMPPRSSPPGSAAECRELLEGWEVESGKQAKKVLADLARGKHELDKDEKRFLEKHAQEHGGRGLLAYDACSIPLVAGMSYLAGFLEEAAAWEACMTSARRTQQAFTSWEQLGREYLLGWKCLEGEQDAAMHHVFRALVLEKQGPWSIPWRTPLD
jgi:hypothetical protein